MNSTWASPTFVSEETLFLAYCFLTLVVELGVFGIYSLLTDKTSKEAVKLFIVLVIANLSSFFIGYILTFMRYGAMNDLAFLIVLVFVAWFIGAILYIERKKEK